MMALNARPMAPTSARVQLGPRAPRTVAMPARKANLRIHAFFNTGSSRNGTVKDPQRDTRQPVQQQEHGRVYVPAEKRPSAADMRALFSEAQRNIIQMNESRLAALAELAVARSRIAELEEQLANVQAYTPPNAEADTAASAQLNDSDQAATAPATTQPPAASNNDCTAEPLITLVYETGWPQVYLHYNADNAGWTQTPGVRLEDGQGDLAGKRVVTVRGNSLEFVLTDGSNGWDTPDPYGGGSKNYRITEPGTWRLKSGKVGRD